ncbi:uncharacterized protein RSE6_02258 [Rhynchosporium secalis]|uniref:Uncharacterized protein n=1 Tax=Rhynchosporium secalis TaxID=38038 RepID=A0A1E1LZU8_RHYSE|nr:uncharacterized protein RSE6_02258 [Rhynchosporium secalis]
MWLGRGFSNNCFGEKWLAFGTCHWYTRSTIEAFHLMVVKIWPNKIVAPNHPRGEHMHRPTVLRNSHKRKSSDERIVPGFLRERCVYDVNSLDREVTGGSKESR